MNASPRYRLVAHLASLVALALIPLPARAVTNVWGGGGGNANWTTAANWTNSATPGSADTVIFTNGSYASGLATTLGSNWTVNTLVLSTTNTVTIGGSTLTLGSGLLNRTTTSRSNQTINSAIALGADGLFIVNGAVNSPTNLLINGSIGESGGSRSLTVAGGRWIHLMGSNTFTGNLLITNTAGAIIGGTNAASSVTVGDARGAGGTLLVAADYSLGNGTLIINTNAVLASYGTTHLVGNAVTANGNFTVGPSPTLNTVGVGLTFTNLLTLNANLIISNGWNNATETVFFAGGIGDGGAGRNLTLAANGGTRRLMLSNSTYTGSTVINTANLLMSGTNATSSVSLNSGATLTFLTDNPFSSGTMLTVSNAILTSSNSHFFSSPVTFTGTTNTHSGSGNLTFNGVVTMSTSMVFMANGASTADGFAFASNVVETLPGSSLTLGGNLQRNLLLLGSNSYSGGTYISSTARLVIGNNKALGTGTLYAQAAGGTTTLAWTNSPTVANAIQMQNTNLLSGLGISGNKIVFNGPVTMTTNVVISLDSTVPAQDDPSAPVFNGGFTDNGSNFSLTFMGNSGNDRRLFISNSSSYGGGTFINGALVKLGGDNALPTTGALAVNGIVNLLNGFSLNGFNQTVGSLSGTGIVQLASGGTLTVGDANNTSFGGLLVGNGSLVKQGSGTLGLSSSNTFSGGLTIKAGTVALSGNSLSGGGSGLGTIALGDTSGSADATLLGDGRTFTNTIVVQAGSSGVLTMGNSGSSSTVFRGPITLNTNLTVFAGGSGSVNLSSNITGIGGITATGPGGVTLGGWNSFSGGVTANGATMTLQNFSNTMSWALGTGTFTIATNTTISGSSTVALGTANPQAWNSSFTVGNFSLVMGTGTVTLGTNVTVTGSGASSIFTVPGSITGAWALVKAGAGTTMRLSGSNSYSGGTTVDEGTLTAQHGDALGTGSVVVNAGAILQFNGGASAWTNHSATITGAGGVEIKNNALVFSMLTSNAYSGGTFIQGNSRVYLGDDFALGTGLITIAPANNGTPSLSSTGSAARTLANNLVFSNGNNLSLGNATDNGALTFNGTADLTGDQKQWTIASPVTFAGVVSNGGITKAGAGVLTLSGSNVFSGPLTISNGTVVLANTWAAQNATVSNTISGGVGFSNATAFTVAALAGSGDMALTNAGGGGIALTVGGNNVSTTFGGSLTGGNGSLIKTGSGSLTLSNASLSSVAVSDGTLKLTSNLVVSSGMSVASGAIFDANGKTVTGSVTIASGGWMAANTTAATILPAITGTVSNQGTIFVMQSGAVQNWGGLVNMSNLTLIAANTGGIEFTAADSLRLNSDGSIMISNNLNATRALIAYNAGPVLTNFGSITLWSLSTNTLSGSARIVVGGVTTGNNGGSNLLVNAVGAQIHLISQGGTNAGFPTYTAAADIAAFLRNEGTLTVSGTNASRIFSVGSYGASTNADAGVIVVEDQAALNFYSSNSKRHDFVNLSGGLLSIGQDGALQVLSTGAAQDGSVAGIFRNQGMVTNLGSIVTFFNLTNAVGGTMVSKGSFSTSVVNQGTMTFLAGTSSVAVGTLVSSGSLDLQSGAVLSLNGPFLSGGTLAGSGTILANNATNTGTISPGHSPGTLTFSSNLTLLDSSLLVLEIGGTNAADYDHLIVEGTLSKAGSVLVTNLGWTFASGNTFDFIDAAGWAGAFSLLPLPTLANGLQWNTGLFESAGILSVMPIPEPSALLALSGGAILLVSLRRRKG